MKYFLIIFAFSLPHAVLSQGAFIATDSTAFAGVDLISGTDKDNHQYIQQKKGNRTIKYNPNDLTEYGIKNGKTYVSKEVSIDGNTKRVFLKRLQRGDVTLYYYEAKGVKLFFLEKSEGVLIELNKNNYKKVLAEYTNEYDWMKDQLYLVRFNEKSMSNLISSYNSGQYEELTFVSFGIGIGYNTTKLIASSELIFRESTLGNSGSLANYIPNSSIAISAFVDLPITQKGLSFNTGFTYVQHEMKSESTFNQKQINFSMISIPLLVKYVIPVSKFNIKPYINAGANVNMIFDHSVKRETNLGEIETLARSLSERMIGYSVGGGIQYRFYKRHIIGLDYRYSQSFGQDFTFDANQSAVTLSFSF